MAKLFATHGAKVIIADIQDERGHSICKEFPTISYVHCDVTKESDIENAINDVISKHGKLDIMFNNAEIIMPVQNTSALELEKRHFEKVFDLCLELGEYGIRVNCVSPFLISTPLLGDAMGSVVAEEAVAEWVAAAANLKGTVAETDDIVEAVFFLGSDESKYMSGLNMVVDGGYSKVNLMITMAMRGVRF
ncbi:hypothetical protein BUALT_Bualt09G0091700 [Buddleja alternifolia]|uniref:Uncharacterized protein n=1 Tax=Buddleja alternifolia TaxID=168488 RepID=A0AAV6XBU3_9LAMI|nr:hypothetical protein BUALT_Bualt09G0091700 [Buddleja alternifolia]